MRQHFTVSGSPLTNVMRLCLLAKAAANLDIHAFALEQIAFQFDTLRG